MFSEIGEKYQHLCIIQAENPDGDSIGAATALYNYYPQEVTLYCPVNIPRYLRYFKDWSVISPEFDFKADAYIIVDTNSSLLLSRLIDDKAILNRLTHAPVYVIDHHETASDLPFDFTDLSDIRSSCCEVIYDLIKQTTDQITPEVAENLAYGIEADTLGLTTATISPRTFHTMGDLLSSGIDIADMEERRRQLMKKSPRILQYKADLIKRVEYFLDGKLAMVHVPWSEIEEYSDEYNPGALIIEELRLVEGVEVAICIKTYPDGRLTGKIRTTTPVAEQLASYFGGGGHPYASGFRTYGLSYDEAVKEIISALSKITQA